MQKKEAPKVFLRIKRKARAILPATDTHLKQQVAEIAKTHGHDIHEDHVTIVTDFPSMHNHPEIPVMKFVLGANTSPVMITPTQMVA